MSACEPLRPNERNCVLGQILETAQFSLFATRVPLESNQEL